MSKFTDEECVPSGCTCVCHRAGGMSVAHFAPCCDQSGVVVERSCRKHPHWSGMSNDCLFCKREADDRWEKTSFADSTEAAIHHALIEFSLALDDRRQGRTGTMHPDESDIFIEHRRLVRDLATGVKDSDEYLESLS